MDQDAESAVFLEFKQRYQQDHRTPNEAEEAFFIRMAPSIARMARNKLTHDVRRLFDTNDITSTVMRRIVSQMRSGQLKLESEGQFKAFISTMTKRAIIDKYDYLHGLLRDQSRNVSLDNVAGGSESLANWDLTAQDDHRYASESTGATEPIDDLILAEKIKSLNELCAAVRKYLGSPDDWELFRLRFFEELTWQQIGEQLGVTPDSARVRMTRNIERLRPKIQQFREWLDQQP
jgi:RNA polymerase sigma factor (sigma-70 family)